MYVPDDPEADKIDFSWGVFYVRYVLGAADRIMDMSQRGQQPTFLLIDHQQGRLTER